MATSTEQLLRQGYESSLSSRNQAIGLQRQAGLNALDQLEGTMNRQVGMMQLQRERDIASRRMRGVRSGTSSGALASQEMQNLMASRIGAQQIADQYNDRRYELLTQFAGQEQMSESYLMQDLMDDFLAKEGIDAQKYANSYNLQAQDAYGESYNALSAKNKAIIQAYLSGFADEDSTGVQEALNLMG